MKKEPLFIELAGRKGEAGKTTFTVLTAGILHYRRGYNAAVADCDPLQHCIGLTGEKMEHPMTNLM